MPPGEPYVAGDCTKKTIFHYQTPCTSRCVNPPDSSIAKTNVDYFLEIKSTTMLPVSPIGLLREETENQDQSSISSSGSDAMDLGLSEVTHRVENENVGELTTNNSGANLSPLKPFKHLNEMVGALELEQHAGMQVSDQTVTNRHWKNNPQNLNSPAARKMHHGTCIEGDTFGSTAVNSPLVNDIQTPGIRLINSKVSMIRQIKTSASVTGWISARVPVSDISCISRPDFNHKTPQTLRSSQFKPSVDAEYNKFLCKWKTLELPNYSHSKKSKSPLDTELYEQGWQDLSCTIRLTELLKKYGKSPTDVLLTTGPRNFCSTTYLEFVK